MADTADLRSEGKASKSKQAIENRVLRRQRLADGLCVCCGKTEVLNRKTCYDCSLTHSTKTYLSGLRHFCKELEINPEKMVTELESLPWRPPEIQQLIDLMKIACYSSEAHKKRHEKACV